MKYRVEYEAITDFEKMMGVSDDYAYGVIDLKHIIKNATHPIKCITKVYADGAGIDITSKYIKPFDLCEIMCR